MTLGEKIAHLRTKHKLSQGDLAEKLNVSRQSVSKWETNTSIPELDKLIQLSDLFQISLDDLVRQDQPEQSRDEAAEPKSPDRTSTAKPMGIQKIIGLILLGIGLLCGILGLLSSRVLFGIGLYLLLCSILCLTLKRYAGLVIGWVSLLLFLPLGNYIRYDYFWVILCGLMAVMLLCTFLALRRRSK